MRWGIKGYGPAEAGYASGQATKNDRLSYKLLLLLLATAPAFASGLQFTLTPAVELGAPGGSVVFMGSLVDSDTDSSNLFLNFIDVTLTPPADTDLSVDPNYFSNVVTGLLTGDGVPLDDTYTGGIFKLIIDPNTPAGSYFGSITILGGKIDNNDANPLATQSFQVNVTGVPEPSTAILLVTGLVILVIPQREKIKL